MNKELLEALRTVIREELEPVKKELIEEIQLSQQQLSKDIATSLGQYADKFEQHIDNKTEALNKRVYKLETEIERITRQ